MFRRINLKYKNYDAYFLLTLKNHYNKVFFSKSKKKTTLQSAMSIIP